MSISPKPASTAVLRWLAAICLMVIAMVAVGGITRLTGSGLSITEWRPIMGAIPPLDETQWLDAFEKYKAIPQYRIINQGMELGEFKWIFFWEYIHRLLGRSIALVFIIPWIWLARRKLISKPLHKRLVVGFLLFFAQGVMGWLMVVSGLSERTSVSHYRLAAHFMLALTALGYMLWVLKQELSARAARAEPRALVRVTQALIALLGLQLVYGAFMAGTKAGHMYPTFPKMHGQWIPEGTLQLMPSWLNFLENPVAIHFTHRTLGWVVVAGMIALGFALRLPGVSTATQRRGVLVILLTLTQFLLGILTVLSFVSIELAVSHQVCGALLAGALLWMYYGYAPARR